MSQNRVESEHHAGKGGQAPFGMLNGTQNTSARERPLGKPSLTVTLGWLQTSGPEAAAYE